MAIIVGFNEINLNIWWVYFILKGGLSSYLECRVQRIKHMMIILFEFMQYAMGYASKIPNGSQRERNVRWLFTSTQEEICHCAAQQWQNKQHFSSLCSSSVVAFNINLSLKQLKFYVFLHFLFSFFGFLEVKVIYEQVNFAHLILIRTNNPFNKQNL